MKIELIKPGWQEVFGIVNGTVIIKGRHGVYWELREACKKVTYQFGCYSWQVSDQVQYCGSFSKDNSKEEFTTNLEGRVHSYWQTHRVKKTGMTNTNKHVFDHIQNSVKSSDVSLQILKFDELQLDSQSIDFNSYSTNPDLIKAVEQLVICYYRSQGQCTWNRA